MTELLPLNPSLQVNRFFAKTLTHVKGQWSGRPFEFIEWQEYVISKLFGTVGDDGLRTYRTCYIEIPRKNGKSTFCAGTALYMLFADKEPGAEIYSAAADREQASIVFDVASQIWNAIHPFTGNRVVSWNPKPP